MSHQIPDAPGSESSRFSPLTYYLVGTGSWFTSHGIQNVMFAWLVTIVLNESPTLIGVAHFALLFPATLLMLVGGSLSDRLGGKQVAATSQFIAVIPIACLAVVLLVDQLSFAVMLGYAICIGSLQAFVTPARDGMLNHVARGRIQRTVVKVTLIQFLVQMGGFLIAGTADTLGGSSIMFIQASIVCVGAFALLRLPSIAVHSSLKEGAWIESIGSTIVAGFRSVWSVTSMRMVMLQNFAMGICFMGSYVVIIPLLIREQYEGSAEDLALVNLVNSTGLVLTILLQLFLREITHKGNALLIAHGIGAIVLSIGSFSIDFPYFLVMMFCWGACGGVAMSMSRTIMQEQAPNDQRGSVMSIFSFSFMGAGPIGAVLWGVTAQHIGPTTSLFIACMVMLVVVLTITAYKKRLGVQFA